MRATHYLEHGAGLTRIVVADQEDAYKAAPLGLLVLILLGLACYALFRSMSKHLRKVGTQFPGQPVEPGPRTGPDFPVSPGYPISAVFDDPPAQTPRRSPDPGPTDPDDASA